MKHVEHQGVFRVMVLFHLLMGEEHLEQHLELDQRDDLVVDTVSQGEDVVDQGLVDLP